VYLTLTSIEPGSGSELRDLSLITDQHWYDESEVVGQAYAFEDGIIFGTNDDAPLLAEGLGFLEQFVE
jgi:hypothetical protein